MAQQQSLEIKVGAFIVLGFALLVFFIFVIGDISALLRPSYEIRVQIQSANGITTGSPVQFAGVEVGKVTEVDIVQPSQEAVANVEMRVRLPQSVIVHTEDKATISMMGLLGEKYLEITPAANPQTVLRPGQVLLGIPPVSTDEMLQRSNLVLGQLEQTLEVVNKLVQDPEAITFIKETLVEVRDATRNWRVLGERANMMVYHAEQGEGNLGKLLYDEELYDKAIFLLDEVRANPWKLMFKPKQKKGKD